MRHYEGRGEIGSTSHFWYESSSNGEWTRLQDFHEFLTHTQMLGRAFADEVMRRMQETGAHERIFRKEDE